MRSNLERLTLPIMAGWLTTGAAADIISTSSSVLIQPLPDVLLLGAKEDTDHAFVFEERHGLVLAAPLHVDLIAPFDWTATIGQPVPPAALGGDLPAGLGVNSHLVHYDPVGTTLILTRVEGTIAFQNPVLGAIVMTQHLNDSDSLLGVPGTVYAQGFTYRGMEEFDHAKVTLVDPYTVEFRLFAGPVMNEFRVITAIPEPAPALLAIIGLLLTARRTTPRRPR